MTTEEQSEPRQSRNMGEMSFRDTEVLQRYVTETGKMLPRRITGLTAKQQRHFSREIKRSRNMLLMQ